jgi:hypothetical protein
MQARPKIVLILVVALIVSLGLFFYGRAINDRVWFNLPSIPVNVQADGSASVFGFNLGAVLPANLVQQLQGAGVQQLEVRAGHSGVYILSNGNPLPYIKWNNESAGNLQELLPKIDPQLQQVADYLPWLRRIGLGATLRLPGNAGRVVSFRGEDSIRPAPGTATIGPIVIGSLTFDTEGNMFVEGVPAGVFANVAPGLPTSLDPATLATIRNLGIQTAQIVLQPNGLDISINGEPLPSLAYDEKMLANAQPLAAAFVADPAQAEMLNTVFPILGKTDLTVAVSFTGEQTVQTQLPHVDVALQPDGSFTVLGLPIGQANTIPADFVKGLQDANVQQLAVSLQPEGLYLGINGQPLPSITWSGDQLGTLAVIVGGMTDMSPEEFSSVLDVVTNLGANAVVSMPPAEGVEAIEVPEEPNLQVGTVEPNPQAPVIRLSATVDGNGQIHSVGDFNETDLAALSLPVLPAGIIETLAATGASEVGLINDLGKMNIVLDGNSALTFNYDATSLAAMLDLVMTLTGGAGMLADPGVSQIVHEQLLPQLPAADIDISLVLE